jgi:hypothetical protein
MKYKTPLFLRNAAAQSQNWRCHYCELPMGGKGSPYAKAVPLEKKHLRMTAEHLLARQDGGADTKNKIVAAHTFCNQHRHRSKRPKSPTEFATHVKSRLAKKQWFVPPDRKLLIQARRTIPVNGMKFRS